MHAIRPARFVFGALTFATMLGALDVRAEYDWLQFGGTPQHNSNNVDETLITPANVASLWRRFQVLLPAVAGGTPVFLANVATANGVRDVLYVATMSGHIYALDARTGATIWAHLVPCGTSTVGGFGCNTTSSPAIDPSRRFVYAYGLDGFVHKYAVGDGTETTTGGWPELVTRKLTLEKVSSPLAIAATSSGTFLYVPTGGYPGDQGDYQGHLTTIDVNSGSQNVFNALCSDQTIHFGKGGSTGFPTCAATQSAIWSRAGTVFDPDVNKIFLATGNGHFAPSTHYWGDSVLALNPNGTGTAGGPLDSYTPATFASLDGRDSDLGSTGPVVFPTGWNAKFPHLAAQGGKDGIVRLLNLDNLSGQGGTGFTGGEIGNVVQLGSTSSPAAILPSPATWTNPADGSHWLFVSHFYGTAGIQVGTDANGFPVLTPVWQNTNPGTSLNTQVTSASPLVANGVLYYGSSDKVLHAVNPTTGALLWQDSTSLSTIKWQSPIVANGMLYIADQRGVITGWESPAPLLVGWGSNSVGQVNGQIPDNPVPSPRVTADDGGNVVQAASGSQASASVHVDGTVWTWGAAIMLGDGSTTSRATPGPVPGLPRIVQVATGFQHVLAVGADGSLWAWGDDSCGELGPNATGSLTPVKVPISGVAHATAGNDFSVALKSNGEVWSFGCNDQDQLGQGTSVTAAQVSTPARVSVPYGIIQVSAGAAHGIALRNDGSVWAWGRNTEGQLGIDTTGGAPSSVGVRVDRHVAGITQIATGFNHSLAIDANGAVWNWGANTHGELGDGKGVNEGTPLMLSLPATAAQIEGGQQTSVAVLSDGTLWSWGSAIGYTSDPTHYNMTPVATGVAGAKQIAMDDSTILAFMSSLVQVPVLQYATPDAAASFLQAAGLVLGTATPVMELCQFNGEVIDSDPIWGSFVPRGTVVNVTYVDPGCM